MVDSNRCVRKSKCAHLLTLSTAQANKSLSTRWDLHFQRLAHCVRESYCIVWVYSASSPPGRLKVLTEQNLWRVAPFTPCLGATPPSLSREQSANRPVTDGRSQICPEFMPVTMSVCVWVHNCEHINTHGPLLSVRQRLEEMTHPTQATPTNPLTLMHTCAKMMRGMMVARVYLKAIFS